MIELGGGRRTLEDPIDHSVGFQILVRVGDRVERGQPLLRIFAHSHQRAEMQRFLHNVIRIEEVEVEPLPLILERIGRRPSDARS